MANNAPSAVDEFSHAKEAHVSPAGLTIFLVSVGVALLIRHFAQRRIKALDKDIAEKVKTAKEELGKMKKALFDE